MNTFAKPQAPTAADQPFSEITPEQEERFRWLLAQGGLDDYLLLSAEDQVLFDKYKMSVGRNKRV